LQVPGWGLGMLGHIRDPGFLFLSQPFNTCKVAHPNQPPQLPQV
jgi:hypothetical protein